MPHQLRNKVAIVTGAGSGIGRAIAELFHFEGARVLLADISGMESSVAETLGDGAIAMNVDVSRSVDVRAMTDTAVSQLGALDILCNVAAIDGPLGPMADCSENDFENIISVNLRGVFLGMKYAIPYLLKGSEGCIINISSAAGIVAMPGMSVYGASKAGVVQLTKAAAVEYASLGIRVNAICPGVIDTPMIARLGALHPDARRQGVAMTPLGRLGRPSEIASVALFLASDAASFVTGVALPADGGYSAP